MGKRKTEDKKPVVVLEKKQKRARKKPPQSEDQMRRAANEVEGFVLPTVGRIVHYVARGSADGVFKAEDRAAIVTALYPDDGVISLCILNPTGMFFNEAVAFNANRVPGTWHWPEIV